MTQTHQTGYPEKPLEIGKGKTESQIFGQTSIFDIAVTMVGYEILPALSIRAFTDRIVAVQMMWVLANSFPKKLNGEYFDPMKIHELKYSEFKQQWVVLLDSLCFVNHLITVGEHDYDIANMSTLILCLRNSKAEVDDVFRFFGRNKFGVGLKARDDGYYSWISVPGQKLKKSDLSSQVPISPISGFGGMPEQAQVEGLDLVTDYVLEYEVTQYSRRRGKGCSKEYFKKSKCIPANIVKETILNILFSKTLRPIGEIFGIPWRLLRDKEALNAVLEQCHSPIESVRREGFSNFTRSVRCQCQILMDIDDQDLIRKAEEDGIEIVHGIYSVQTQSFRAKRLKERTQNYQFPKFIQLLKNKEEGSFDPWVYLSSCQNLSFDEILEKFGNKKQKSRKDNQEWLETVEDAYEEWLYYQEAVKNLEQELIIGIYNKCKKKREIKENTLELTRGFVRFEKQDFGVQLDLSEDKELVEMEIEARGDITSGASVKQCVDTRLSFYEKPNEQDACFNWLDVVQKGEEFYKQKEVQIKEKILLTSLSIPLTREGYVSSQFGILQSEVREFRRRKYLYSYLDDDEIIEELREKREKSNQKEFYHEKRWIGFREKLDLEGSLPEGVELIVSQRVKSETWFDQFKYLIEMRSELEESILGENPTDEEVELFSELEEYRAIESRIQYHESLIDELDEDENELYPIDYEYLLQYRVKETHRSLSHVKHRQEDLKQKYRWAERIFPELSHIIHYAERYRVSQNLFPELSQPLYSGDWLKKQEELWRFEKATLIDVDQEDYVHRDEVLSRKNKDVQYSTMKEFEEAREEVLSRSCIVYTLPSREERMKRPLPKSNLIQLKRKEENEK